MNIHFKASSSCAVFGTFIFLALCGREFAAEDSTRADGLVREILPLIHQMDSGEAVEGKLREALKLYEDAANVQGQAECHMLLGILYGRRETYPDARRHYDRSVELWRQLGYRIGAWQAIYGLAESSRFSGENGKALEVLDEAQAVLRELRDPEVSLDMESLSLVAMRQGLPPGDLAELQHLLPNLRELLVDNFTVMTLISRSEVLINQANYGDALAALEEALPKAAGLMVVLEPKVLNGMGKVHLARGDLEKAKSDFEQARTKSNAIFEMVTEIFKLSGMELESSGDLRIDEVVALKSLATIGLRTGHYDEALETQGQALAILGSTENPPLQAQIIAEMGLVHLNQGHYGRAQEGFEQALEIAQAAGAQDAKAMILGYLALFQNLDGHHEEALRLHGEALEIFRLMGHRAQEAQALLQMGESQVHLRRLEAALENFEEARKLVEEIEDPTLQHASLIRISVIHFQIGDSLKVSTDERERQIAKALETARESLELALRLDDPTSIVESQTALGWILIRLEDFEKAILALEEARTLAREHGYLAGEGIVELALGFCQSRFHRDHESATMAFRRSLEIFQELGSDNHIVLALTALGASYRRQGDLAAAGQAWEEAAAKLDAFQHEMRVQEFETTFNAFFPSSVSAGLVDLYASQNEAAKAFLHAERSRAKTLLKSLGQSWIAPESDGEFSNRVRVLKRELTRIENDLARADRSIGPEVLGDSDVEWLRRRLVEAREELLQALVDLELYQPEAAALVAVDALPLERVQKEVLDDETTLVAFYVFEGRVLAWVVDQNESHMVKLDLGLEVLEQKIQHLEEMVRSQDFDHSDASVLFQGLIAPLQPHIRHRQLVLIPHGILHQLPFAVLWDATRERYLIEDYSLTYAPSASVLRFLKPKRSPNSGRLLALGNPDGSLSQAEEEVRTIAKLYGTSPHLGAAATEERLRSTAQDVDIVHLAVHAQWNEQQPEFSRLELAPGNGHDGRLEVHEIFRELDLRGVNLVVLAACETMRGKRTRGDEIMGLTRALLYAGSPAVITTSWKIDDGASRFLMETFHRRLRDGEPVAEALRLAQLATLERAPWASPYYWAAFGLHGDWRTVK